MKILLTILSFFIFSNIMIAQDIVRKIKVTQIDSTDTYYFIKGVIKKNKKDKILIISKKNSTILGCEKIKVKNTYLLKLSNYFSDEEINRLPAKPPGTLQIREEGYIIWDGKSSFPYKSTDIKSIYYMPN